MTDERETHLSPGLLARITSVLLYLGKVLQGHLPGHCAHRTRGGSAGAVEGHHRRTSERGILLFNQDGGL